jgi:ElaA protein
MSFNSTNLTWHFSSWNEITRDQFYALAALRIDVFVIEQNCPYQDFDGKDRKSHHLWCTDVDGQVHAVLRIVQPGVSYAEVSIGRVATSQAARGSGLGRSLMRRGMQCVVDQYGDVPVRISAQSYLTKFYSSFGFISEGESYLEDDIPHIEMLYTP